MAEIEKSVYDAQAMKWNYRQLPHRLTWIIEYIMLAAKYNNYRFIQQTLGHGLYTAIEIEKRKAGRKKRCGYCSTVGSSAGFTYMERIMHEMGPDKFDEMIGVRERVTLMFAIDDTASMGGEIEAAKAIATYIVDHPKQDTKVDYILSPFNDPSM